MTSHGARNGQRRREYGSSTDVLTRHGGVFWGIVLILVGVIWLLGSMGYITLGMDIVLPLLVILFGVWMLVKRVW